ncbi:unnamed protein product [Rhodiola kirilowii]
MKLHCSSPVARMLIRDSLRAAGKTPVNTSQPLVHIGSLFRCSFPLAESAKILCFSFPLICGLKPDKVHQLQKSSGSPYIELTSVRCCRSHLNRPQSVPNFTQPDLDFVAFCCICHVCWRLSIARRSCTDLAKNSDCDCCDGLTAAVNGEIEGRKKSVD